MYNPIWFVSAATATATAVLLLFYFFSFVYSVFATLPFSTLCILFVLDLLNISQTKKFAAHFISAKIQKIVSFMFSLCTFQSVVQITWKCRCLIMESSKYLLNFFSTQFKLNEFAQTLCIFLSFFDRLLLCVIWSIHCEIRVVRLSSINFRSIFQRFIWFVD